MNERKDKDPLTFPRFPRLSKNRLNTNLVITWNKKHSSKQVASITYTLERTVFAAAAFEGLSVVSIRRD